MILQNAGEGSILDHGLYISAMKHVMKVILCSCAPLVFINRICKQLDLLRLSDSARCTRSVHGLYLSFDTGWGVNMQQESSSVI